LARTHVDCVILDVMMPGEDGLAACRRVARRGGPEVILLSALGEEQDRILGLEVGAGHYLPKPCSPREILATVRAALRKRGVGPAPASEIYGFDGWRIDLGSHELFDPNGVLVGLTDGEFAVLRVFIERPRRVLSREALLQAARGPDSDAYDRAIDVQVSRLRRKLRAGGDEIIRTVRNEGYLFVPRVVRA
jgi:two-component system OmpR family response regulator